MTVPVPPLSPQNPQELQKILDAVQLRGTYEEIDKDKDTPKFDVILAGKPCTGKSVVCDILAEVFGIKATQVTIFSNPERATLCDLDLKTIVAGGKPVVILLECSQAEILKRHENAVRKRRGNNEFLPLLEKTMKAYPTFLKQVGFQHVIDCTRLMPCEVAGAVLEILGKESPLPSPRNGKKLSSRRGAFLEAHKVG